MDPKVRLQGEGVSAGRAAGPVHVVEDLQEAPEDGRHDKTRAAEAALASVAARLEALAAMRQRTSTTGAQLLEGQALIARDPALRQEVLDAIAEGAGVSEAITLAAEYHAAALERLPDEYLRERATDVREVARLARGALRGGGESRLAKLARPAVVFARELTAADLLATDRGLLLALVTETGGRQSHAAIVARELGIPAVVRAADVMAAARRFPAALVDGDSGEVELVSTLPAGESSAARRVAVAEVGFVQLMANVSSVPAAAEAAASGARGVGLLRTEMLFLGRADPASEEEQLDIYRQVARAVAPNPAVIRTLDAGSDKLLPWLKGGVEPNPALGRRGLRLWLSSPRLARTQVRALLRAHAETGNVQVMCPMVSAPEEMEQARAVFVREADALGIKPPPIGMMVEVPAAALRLDAFSGLADFVSLGTNDLAQYAIGADRELSWESPLGDFNPGFLRLLELALRAAAALSIPAGVCGELAGRPEGAVLLAGLGATSLSMSLGSLPAVAMALARLGRDGCIAATGDALRANRAGAAEAALRSALAQP